MISRPSCDLIPHGRIHCRLLHSVPILRWWEGIFRTDASIVCWELIRPKFPRSNETSVISVNVQVHPTPTLGSLGSASAFLSVLGHAYSFASTTTPAYRPCSPGSGMPVSACGRSFLKDNVRVLLQQLREEVEVKGCGWRYFSS